MRKYVYEVLDEVSKKRNQADKVKVLRDNESWALKDIIRGSMDSTVKWNLPAGQPPYTPSGEHNHPANLIRENVKFKYFAKGGPGDKMIPVKRETIFLGLIEGIHPKDAALVIAMINKEKPDGLSRPIVEEAFPGLLKD
jgi:hypothetical protein